MHSFLKTKIFAAIFLLFILAAGSAGAAGFIKPGTTNLINNQTQVLTDKAGYETANDDSALYLVQAVINIFLSVIGVLLLVYMLYAGYNWLTAHGEEEKVTKAKDTIKRAVIGAIIIIGAYAISVFVMSRIEQGTLKGGRGVNFNSYNPDDNPD